MRRVRHYIRSRLHRRMFIWFGATILATGALVALSLHFSGAGDAGWRRNVERAKSFLGRQLAESWDDAERRDALGRSLQRDLGLSVRLEGPRGESIGAWGDRCDRVDLVAPVMRGSELLGVAKICFPRHGRPGLTLAVVLGVAALSLWAASGMVARRLVRPLGELAEVADAIGRGNLRARVLSRRSQVGEIGVLADSINEMADRIERQMADQRELLAAVSHEIRSPLSRLRVLSELAREQGTDPEVADDIEREILEIDSLVGELLASSRLDFEALERRELDAGELAKRALEREGLSLSILRVQAADAKIHGDPTLLSRALCNLLDNARRHGGGATGLVIKRVGRALRFEVEDDGAGFSAADLPRVFEKFVRGERSAGSSLGLGLSLVRRIAEAHGGRAFAENRDGSGARVGFEIVCHGSAGGSASSNART